MVCVMMRRSEMQVLSIKFWSCSPISVHAQVLDLDDLAAARAQTSAQTAAEHINLRSVHLLCRPLQARTAAVTHLPSAPAAPAGSCRRVERQRRDRRPLGAPHREGDGRRLSCAGPGEGWTAGNGRLALQRLHCAASFSPRPPHPVKCSGAARRNSEKSKKKMRARAILKFSSSLQPAVKIKTLLCCKNVKYAIYFT